MEFVQPGGGLIATEVFQLFPLTTSSFLGLP